jgi:phosphoribosylglycinamide formyltransferase-1
MSTSPKTYRIAIFLSGAGSNAEVIMKYFENHPTIKVVLVVSNNPKAGGLALAGKYDVPSVVVDRAHFQHKDGFLSLLQAQPIDFIVLAGFLWLIPEYLVEAYQNRIINIHPALLPKFGGKGMYGAKVHEAVLAAGETESGITVHFVNTKYDEGQIIGQQTCSVEPGDTPETLAQKVQQLEHKWYPAIIERAVLENC